MSDEPRDPHGKWTDGGGDSTSQPPASPPPHGIKGLPKDIVIHDPLMNQAAERGVWDMVAKEEPKDKFQSGGPRYNVEITAKIPKGIEKFSVKPEGDRVGYYDPKLAELFTVDKGEQYLERTYARPLPGFSQEITPLPGDDIIYRGMRAEEYAKFLQTGKIVSTGTYNMEGQEGLTYWATDPSTAVSYSNGFAPWPHKATFERPAYVVATKMPKETRKVAGTGENEVGVARAIDKSEIVGVWRGDVFWHMPGDQDLNPSSYATDEKVYTAGSGSGPSSSVIWQQTDESSKKSLRPVVRAGGAGHDVSDEARDEHGRWTSGGSSSDYSSSTPSGSEKAKHVAAVFKPTEAAEAAAEKAGRTPLSFHQLTADGNERFHDAITEAKESLKFGASVHAYSADEYSGTKMFVTPDDKAGFALKPDGDIVSAFSMSKAKRAGDSILALAVQQGGRKLDAFDTVLPALYSDNGFRAVARLAWNDEYKPDGWNKNTFKRFNGGKPDVVFMVHDPANAGPYKPGDGKVVKSYEEGVALQTKALQAIDKTRGGKHPGAGYSKDAYVENGVIHTSNVYDAQRALFEDRKVELKQLKQLSTLIKRLGETAAEMAEHGETAPTFNLCNVTVAGTNLFCADQIGIPRAEMPVIRAGATKDFIKYLKKQGYDIEKGTEQSRNLRATQSEISGVKVAAAIDKIKDRGFYKRLVVSRDDYILDGHHTWAAQLAIDAKDGNLKNDGRTVKIARVDISITKLLAEAEKWTGGAGKKPASEAPKGYQLISLRQARQVLDVESYQRFVDVAYQFYARNGHLARGFDDLMITVPRFEFRTFDPDLHPHQPAGSPEGGQFAPTGGGGTGTAPKGKGKAKKEDFDKAKIKIPSQNDEAFLAKWNDKIGMDPEEFRTVYTGGVEKAKDVDITDMRISANGNTFSVSGEIERDGRRIGNFDRRFDLDKKSAYSALFQLTKKEQGSGIGKFMLSGNIDVYKKVGVDHVDVTANIDIGGYSWAKYGYVPTPAAWQSLSAELERKLDRIEGKSGGPSASGDTYEADSWDMLSSAQQEETFRLWASDSHQEFLDSEISNWRDNGQALEEAKKEIAYKGLASGPRWATDALKEVRKERAEKGDPDIPYTEEQIMQAVTIDDYTSRYDDGASDPEFTWDDGELQHPTDVDPAQMDLPGMERGDLSEHLTQDMRDEIVSALTTAFNDKAESDASDIEPPDYLAESVTDYQGEYWDQLSDDERLRSAINYGQANINIEHDDEDDQSTMDLTEEEKQSPEIAELYDALRESNPKNIWKVADSSLGKKLLLDTGWRGVLDLKDPEMMARFNAYVGRATKKQQEKAA